jgi:hypothetical protein
VFKKGPENMTRASAEAGLLPDVLNCGLLCGEYEEEKVVNILFSTVVDESSRLLVLHGRWKIPHLVIF